MRVGSLRALTWILVDSWRCAISVHAVLLIEESPLCLFEAAAALLMYKCDVCWVNFFGLVDVFEKHI